MRVGKPREHPAYLALLPTPALPAGSGASEQPGERCTLRRHPVCLSQGLTDQDVRDQISSDLLAQGIFDKVADDSSIEKLKVS